jgi:4,5-dihydroxyphthalate decarboxylase
LSCVHSGIKEPKVEGREGWRARLSVTTGVWTRGIISTTGLDSSKVTWVVDDEEHVTSLKLPPNVLHAPDGKSLASMMASGELQAGFSGPAGIGRAGPPTGAWEQRAQTSTVSYPDLIANPPEVEAQWFRRTGIYPIHGLIVVKTAVGAASLVAKALFDAFLKAKDAYVARLRAGEQCPGRREIPQSDVARRRSPSLTASKRTCRASRRCSLWPAAGSHSKTNADGRRVR